MAAPVRPLAVVAVLVLLCSSATSAAPKGRYVGCWPVASGAWLELRAHERGTPRPIELRVERAPRSDARACRERGDTAPLAPLVQPVPAPLRVDWHAVRDWRAVATAYWVGADSTRVVDTATTTATLVGEGGELSLAPRPARHGVPDSVALRLTSGGTTREFVVSTAQAWNLVWSLGEQANVFDPDGRADFEGVLQLPQVEVSPRWVTNPGCEVRIRQQLLELPMADRLRAGVVIARFVVGTGGVAEVESMQLDDPQVPIQVQQFVRELVRCSTFRPAKLRGRPVRIEVRQDIWLR